jgi:hypothetical protein
MKLPVKDVRFRTRTVHHNLHEQLAWLHPGGLFSTSGEGPNAISFGPNKPGFSGFHMQ